MATTYKWIDTLKQWGKVSVKHGIIHFTADKKKLSAPCQEFTVTCSAPKLMNYATGRQSCAHCGKHRFVDK